MKSTLLFAGLSLTAIAILAGCSGGSPTAFVPAAQTSHRSEARHIARNTATGYVYVANRTEQGSSELLVYDAGIQNPAPLRSVTNGLVDVDGIAVGPSGHLFVANGAGGNVLEYNAGATSVLHTYSTGLTTPADVAVSNGVLYVTDRGSSANGYAQQVFEYQVGKKSPLTAVGGLGGPSQLNAGIAVYPQGSSGKFFVAASSLTAIPFDGGCAGSTYTVAKNIFPTLWMDLSLSNNQQAWGLAFDSHGSMYVADPCSNAIDIYSDASQTWTYTGSVPGTFNAPSFVTIDNQFLAVPSSGSTGAPESGYVTVIDLSGSTSTVTITSGLDHPIGAAVASGS